MSPNTRAILCPGCRLEDSDVGLTASNRARRYPYGRGTIDDEEFAWFVATRGARRGLPDRLHVPDVAAVARLPARNVRRADDRQERRPDDLHTLIVQQGQQQRFERPVGNTRVPERRPVGE